MKRRLLRQAAGRYGAGSTASHGVPTDLSLHFIFGFITAWNEFLFGLMLTTNKAVPMTVGASFFFAANGGGVQWGVASAVMTLGALPPALLGLLMYRQISGSMTSGAVKG